MSKDSVPLYGPYQPTDSQPLDVLTREEARALKATDQGYFINSGRAMRLVPDRELEPQWENLLKAYSFRDESSCVKEPVMWAFVCGSRRAIAIINAWTPADRLPA